MLDATALLEAQTRTRRDALDALVAATPAGYVYVHYACFHRLGAYLGEWAGYVPEPDPWIQDTLGDERLRRLTRWQDFVVARLGEYTCIEHTLPDSVEEWDRRRAGGHVTVNVTEFQWPVGDHVWHRWDRTRRALDWGEEHTFLYVNVRTRDIEANMRSHRPIRPIHDDRVVIDVTAHPIAAYFGDIAGRFVRREDGHVWLEPAEWMVVDQATGATEQRRTPAALTEAPIDLLPFTLEAKEPVYVQASRVRT